MIFTPISFFQEIISDGGLDPDAEAFLTAAAITDATITTAIDNLVKGLKTNNLWTKMKAIYPIVGGTATAHKFNLKDPRDLDAAFRLQFLGGITHNSNGMTGNGTNGYADTKLAPSSQLIDNNHHVSFFSRQVAGSNTCEIGVESGTNRIVFHTRWGDGNLYSDSYTQTTGRIAVSISDGTGFFVQSRTNSTTHKAYRNGTQVGSTNTSSSAGSLSSINRPIFLLAANANFGLLDFSTKPCSFASIGDGLSDTEVSNLSTLVSNFQSNLGRSL
jgi:hypothetical protein